MTGIGARLVCYAQLLDRTGAQDDLKRSRAAKAPTCRNYRPSILIVVTTSSLVSITWNRTIRSRNYSERARMRSLKLKLVVKYDCLTAILLIDESFEALFPCQVPSHQSHQNLDCQDLGKDSFCQAVRKSYRVHRNFCSTTPSAYHRIEVAKMPHKHTRKGEVDKSTCVHSVHIEIRFEQALILNQHRPPTINNRKAPLRLEIREFE